MRRFNKRGTDREELSLEGNPETFHLQRIIKGLNVEQQSGKSDNVLLLKVMSTVGEASGLLLVPEAPLPPSPKPL